MLAEISIQRRAQLHLHNASTISMPRRTRRKYDRVHPLHLTSATSLLQEVPNTFEAAILGSALQARKKAGVVQAKWN